MKLFLIFLIIVINKANAQSKDFIDIVSKTIGLSLNTIPQNSLYDSCYYSSTLLKIQFSRRSKVISILFSDNADEWLLTEMEKAKKRIDFKKIEKYAKKERIKKVNLVFPFIIRSITFPCARMSSDLITKSKYFIFNQKPLSGRIKFCDLLEYPFYYKN
jgi:hypothetical protein